ncbi:MAG: bifunctional phosphoribosyl-AMP cyclohydrolase/phosphoribosyl-ATP diphosphatase HisIE [Proteobacteria bacterium]|nr:bifunctional phosphoribosyl-AMP cyclohydrolase/phosphoribosyl-ATP diphosphatase HisIE [Pseudomonadota bacterium]
MIDKDGANREGELENGLDWDKVGGLIPAVVQHVHTLQVLMVAYMDRDALRKTLVTGHVTFFSRSKKRLWTKGETSGHVLDLVDIVPDCDGDALLVRAVPRGPTCHLGTTSCFGAEKSPGLGFLAHLDHVIAERQRDLPEGSYTADLFRRGIGRMAQKVGEEGVEVALAAKDEGTDNVESEAADLIYHLLVLLRGKDTQLAHVVELLRGRHG